MNDLISRKRALKAIEKLHVYGFATLDEDKVIKTINKLPSVTPKEKTGWIPVSERLPEECSGVLVYCPENKNIFLAYLEIGKWYIFSPNADEPIDEPIVAWMPLPAPFETQESEKI